MSVLTSDFDRIGTVNVMIPGLEAEEDKHDSEECIRRGGALRGSGSCGIKIIRENTCACPCEHSYETPVKAPSSFFYRWANKLAAAEELRTAVRGRRAERRTVPSPRSFSKGNSLTTLEGGEAGLPQFTDLKACPAFG